MKLPGDAWLQFRICHEPDGNYLEQLAVFRPDGLSGRLYWYAMVPFHFVIFRGMIRNIIHHKETVIPPHIVGSKYSK